MSVRSYFLGVLLATVPPLAAISATNFYVDPEGAFEPWSAERFAPGRARLTRAAKAEALHAGWDVVLVGTSRVEAGFDPRGPEWQGARVFNCGLARSNLLELSDVFRYALRAARPRLVLLGVDLHAFNPRRGHDPTFKGTRFDPELDVNEHVLAHLFGRDQLEASLEVLRGAQRAGDPLGGRRLPAGRARLRSEGNLQQFFRDDANYRGFEYDPRRRELLRQMVLLARREQVDLRLVVLPVHVTDLEAMRLMGLNHDFERMKRDLVAFALEANSRGSGPTVQVWDFSGYEGRVAEPIPLGDEGMTWHYDSSHFNPELGALVAARLLDQPTADRSFGVELVSLGPIGLEAHLALRRAQREAWARANPKSLAWLDGVLERAERGLQLERQR